MKLSENDMDEAIERYNKAKENGTLDEEFPVIMTLPTNNEIPEWEKAFDKRFAPLCIDSSVGDGYGSPSGYIKDFISTLLASQEQRIWDMCEEMKVESILLYKDQNVGYNNALSDLQAKLTTSNEKS